MTVRSAVLAGGAASRFGGRAKGLELVGGARILDRVVDAVREATGSDPLLVANAADAEGWYPGLEIVSDVVPNCGSLGGIYTAVTAAEEPVLVVAWDMPFVSTDLLRALLDGSAGFDVFLPGSGGPLGIEPLCAVYGPACGEPIRASIEAEDLRTTTFHEAVRVGRLPRDAVAEFGDPEVLFFNVNQPDDLQVAESMWRAQQA
jgi:molybdopterin-guanine dinucleotide biosynthesis protein A